MSTISQVISIAILADIIDETNGETIDTIIMIINLIQR